MIAIITSVIILLTPIQASAVTWGEIVTGLQASDTFTSGETTATRTSKGEYVISGGQIEELVEVSKLQFSDSLKVLFQNIGIEQLNAHADSGKTIVIILGSGSEVTDRVIASAHGKDTNLSLTNEGKMRALNADAYDQAQAAIKNNGEIVGMVNRAHGEGSRLEFVNDKEGRITGGMDNGAGEKGELVFTNNGTISGEHLFNGAFDGGVLKNTNNGTINATNDLHNLAADGGFVESTNNGTINVNGRVMNQANEEGSRNVATNNGTVNGQYEFYTGGGGEVSGENNGTVNSLYAGADGGQVSAVNNGKVKEEIRADASHESMKADVTVINNGEADRMYVSAGENGMLNVENNGRLTGDGKTWITIEWEDGEISRELSGELSIDAWDKGATVNVTNNGSAAAAFIGAADGANASLKNDGQIGNGEGVPLSSYAAEDGRLTVTGNGSLEPYTLKMEDGTERTVSMIAQFGGNPSAEEIKRRVGEMVQFDSPGDYLVMVITEDENGETVFHYVPVHIENQQDFEDEDYEAARFRHEMEMKRQAGAVGGVYGSPYWVKQLYLGYHSYNLRLFVDETRENFREKLSWSADGSKGVSLRVNDENPEKLTMRFDEKVLEVLERTNITTVTLLNKSGATVMQYNVSDLRAAYDQYGLSDADQLVVGGMDDDVMKIGADGQLVPVE